jgi:serine protease Do
VPVPAQEDALAINPARSAVLFFDDAPVGTGPFSSLLPGGAFGAGLVLTSDGWILAHASSFSKGRVPTSSVAVIGGEVYPILAFARDPFTGVVFLKVEASNLPVTAFGSSADLPAGGLAFSIGAMGDVHRLSVRAFGDTVAVVPSDLLKSSERMQKSLRLADADGLLPGSMVLTRDGEVAAIIVAVEGGAAAAIPFESFSGIISGVLRDGKASRPLLGVNYIDRSRLMGVESGDGRGALLVASADGRVPAIVRGSPAALAGLKAGEVIMAVNGEQLTAKTALADLVAQYAPGSTLSFTVAGTEGERRVDIVLGTAVAP